MKKTKPIPKFKNIEEESNFWDTHSTEEYGNWAPITKTEFLNEIHAEKKNRISIRIENELLAQLKKKAKTYKMPYQTFTRFLIKTSLAKV